MVWNFGRFDEKAPQWNAQQFALARAYLPNFAGVEKVDDHTVALTTKVPSSLFPYEMSFVVMTSRCRAEALKYDWAAVANQPSGTGPYRFDRMVAHERLEMTPNRDYWDKARIPKQDRLVLLPMPEASTRTAALLSGQVNFIEAPSPDAIPRLKAAGMQIVTNSYPHNWNYQLNIENGPCKVTLAISTSGSGQMQPLPMNELVKSQLDEAGFDVTLQVMDWNALLALARAGEQSAPGVDGINVSRSIQDPIAGITRFTQRAQWAPNGSNWGHYTSPEMEALITQAFNEFDPAKREPILERMHEKMVDDAVMIWVVHDINPRALSPKVHGFVQAQSWLQDLTPITIAK